MALHAYLQVGLSFANIGLFEQEGTTTHLKAHRRFYMPQEPLGTALKKFWQEFGTPQSLKVSSRFLEKILDAKLGGTVAQVVTSGFETWPILRQPVLPNHFHMQPYRQEPLASQELIFGLSERVNYEGQVLKPLEIKELDFINSKLKLMGVKRVCVNLLFSQINSSHQEQVARYFLEQGFEVLASVRNSNSGDEMPAWRKNVINACLSGAFAEHVEDIRKSFSETSLEFSFLDRQSLPFETDKNRIAGSLFSWTHLLAQNFASQAEKVIYLGLENWCLISTTRTSPYWKSPWGLIEGAIPLTQNFEVQPTQEITSGFWGGIHFSKNDLGYEPGPMSFGRALKPTVFDVLSEKIENLPSQIQASGTKKFRDQMTAMVKNISELQGSEVDQLLQDLTAHLVQRLAIESHFKSEPGAKNTIVTGAFARHFFPLLKKKWLGSKLILDPLSEQSEIYSMAQLSARSTGGGKK